MTPTETLRFVVRLLRAQPARTAGLVVGLAATVFLPALLGSVGAVGIARVQDRLAGAPVIVLAPGDPLLGTWSTLTGAGAPDGTLPLAEAVWPGSLPLRTGRTVETLPLVGVDGAWTAAWGLSVARGRPAVRPGEVVVGAGAARRLGVKPGDALQADPLGSVLLDPPPGPMLTVVGVLASTPSPEQHWVLTPLATTWMLDGALHGEEGALHLHGDASEQPVSAVVVRPPSAEARDLLLVELDGRSDRQGVLPAALARERLRPLQPLQASAVALGGLLFGALALLLFNQVQQHAAARHKVHALLAALGASPGDLARLRLTEGGVLGGAALGLSLLGTVAALAALGHWP